MLEILNYTFFQNALLVSLLASIAAGIVGSLVVLKKMSFISGAVAHASLGGLGIAYFFGFSPILGAAIFSVLSALGVGWVSKKARSHEDSLIGAMWAVGMSIGLIFIFLTPGYATNLFSYLFGNILLTTTGDIVSVIILDAVVIISIIILFRRLLALIFDEEFCQVTNVKVLPLYFFLLALVALTVVILIKVVGIILVIALLTLPAATAQIFSKSLRGIIIWSMIDSAFSTIAGLFLSYYFNWPTGPVIILLAALLYMLVLVGKNLLLPKKVS